MRNDSFFIDKLKKRLPFVSIIKGSIVNRIRKLNSNYGKEVYGSQRGNDLIAGRISSGLPLMVARLGSNELECITNYARYRNKSAKWNESIRKRMSIQAGFFPATDEMMEKFSINFLDYVKDIDVMGIWYNPNEDYICRNYCPNSELVALTSLEPYYHSNPWSNYLNNKKVLVIHPYDETIRSQFNNRRSLLFANKDVLPPFELQTLKAVQSIANNESSFGNWFEAYDYMCNEIIKKDFDIAIIGAGAYGLPLASFVKRLGKQAFHMGGATQILFGIKGKRWDGHKVISKLYNEHWIRPSQHDTPKNFSSVENGCYW